MRRQDDVTTTGAPATDAADTAIDAGTTAAGGNATNGTNLTVTTPGPPKQAPQTHYVPIFVLTAIFGAIFIIGPLVVRKGPNRGITRCCIMITAFCMWIFWTTMYISQMNPLMGPRLHNASLAWLGHKWGKNPKTLKTMEETS
uniref:SFRICE_014456 n=1 Tax=Spodoptera frugiperda TaxID=7108 RepID=A0A2H1V525_SPOFR